MKLAWRYATAADVGQLAEWNHQLIRDEGHRNAMNVEQLTERMHGWLQEGYRAVIFSEAEPVAYALFRADLEEIYLRQLFVRREFRRRGIGRAAMNVLRQEAWPKNVRFTVDVLCGNAPAVAFWRSVGYHDYCLTLEIVPPESPQNSNPIIAEISADSAEANRLIAALDADLNRRYPGSPTNGIDAAEFIAAGGYFAVLRLERRGPALACGAFRPVEDGCVEVKRMFVRPEFRGRGFSRLMLRHLETVARQRGYRGLVLETGTRQPEAIGLYKSEGYFRIPNYGHYANEPESVCFAKQA
jgi:GNAT superfamily N-acetyltransferase